MRFPRLTFRPGRRGSLRPLGRRARVGLCLTAIAAAGPMTRAQREDVIARWALPGDVHDRALVALAVYKRLGAVPPSPLRRPNS
jgi:hypothetical protein